MLVLTRKEGQEVVIGKERVIVSVQRIHGDKVVLGFAAPPEIPVHRREVYDEKMAERGEVESLATQDRGTCEETKGEQQ